MTAWIEVLGRSHPLLVHLPIGLVGALLALELFARRHDTAGARVVLATLAALCALATAGTGWLLGHAPDRAATPTLELHQTLGLIVAGLTLPLAALARSRAAGGRSSLGYRLALLATLAVLVPAGHEGSELSHGADWLLGPLHAAPAAPAASVAGGPDFARNVLPILQSRCGACHDEGRHKGGLVLLTPQGLRAGGRDGAVLPAAAGGPSEMLRRLQLPLHDDDHMPPDNKPQPLPAELATLTAWLAAGAPLGADAPANAAATAPADIAPPPPKDALPPAADPAAVAALSGALLHVEPLEPGSTLLWIDAAAVAPTLDDDRLRALLAPVAAQVGSLSLARAPVDDALLPLLAGMPHLRRLDLRGTRVTDAGLRALSGHARLAELVLVRTHLTDAAVDALVALPALHVLHAWSSGLTAEGLARLRAARPDVEVDADESPEAAVLEEEPPVAVGAAPSAALMPVNDVCPVSGQPVDKTYAIVFEGRVIGFCCPKCPPKFWADPAAFKDKIKARGKD